MSLAQGLLHDKDRNGTDRNRCCKTYKKCLKNVNEQIHDIQFIQSYKDSNFIYIFALKFDSLIR